VCHVPHSSDGTAAVDQLPVATEGYVPLVQRHFIVVMKRPTLHNLLCILFLDCIYYETDLKDAILYSVVS
jgi:hypothetical protein